MIYPVIELKKGREAATGFHHPWIFSGAIARQPQGLSSGDIVHVADRNGRVIGTGTFSGGTIAVRLFAFEAAEITQAWLEEKIKAADAKRHLLSFGPNTDTTGYRVVFGEADQLPGLVIDRYEDVIVLQISTAGMDKMRAGVVAACQNIFKPRAVIERSDMPGRKAEGLTAVSGVIAGELADPVQFKENGLILLADVLEGQKTGAYLDQRDLRQQIARFAPGRRVLNLFSYTGAAAVAAIKAGAVSVHNVDESERALSLIGPQLELNGLEAGASSAEVSDAFAWFNQAHDNFDLVILDPPALTKSARDKESAAKAYHFLNRAAMRQLKDGGILVTSSCSHFFTADDLAFVLRRASVQANKKLTILARVGQAVDHPESVYFPESAYLKSFVCLVEGPIKSEIRETG